MNIYHLSGERLHDDWSSGLLCRIVIKVTHTSCFGFVGKNLVPILPVPDNGLFLHLMKKYGVRPMSVQDDLKHMLYGRFRYVVAFFIQTGHRHKYNLTDYRDYIQPSDLLLHLSVYSNTSHTEIINKSKYKVE